ncbi:hypothetical protein [Parafrankia sp. EUN1f]|uniref:hypothetical protein n=1 Tax=Parafrankia sp. EUN1f TaxID=102897 RepID=UPI0001C46CCE|nr:hypothetical protein [Parafrankia sp. EUN1f]EFC80255.1 hypothetical protein FrEUN1fDRAFT_6619 [Parafrankia sp. EUN1f]
MLSNEFGGWKWLKIFLPLNGVEIGILGVHDAYRLAVFGRGLVQTSHYAALADRVDLVTAAGGALRVSDGVLHGVDPPSPGTVRTDTGLLVPDGSSHFSALGKDLGGGVSVKSLDVAGQGGRIITPDSSLTDLNLSLAGKDLGALKPETMPAVRSDLDLQGAVLLEPGRPVVTPADGLPAASNLPAHTTNLLADTHALTGVNPLTGTQAINASPLLSGVSPTGGAELGGLVAPARLAVHHAGDMSATGLPEIRAALNGDVTAVKVSDTQVAFNLGAFDGGAVVPGRAFDAPQVPVTSHTAPPSSLAQQIAPPTVTAPPVAPALSGALPNPAAANPEAAANGALSSQSRTWTQQFAGPPGIHNGVKHEFVTDQLTGHKFGEFAPTRPGPGARANHAVNSALDLLAPPPSLNPHAPNPHVPAADAVSARSVDPALAAAHGPLPRPDTAGMPASVTAQAGGDLATTLAGQVVAKVHGEVSPVLDDFAQISAQVRLAQENLEIARLHGGSEPLASVQKIAQAEKNLRVLESVQSKIAADLQARGVNDPLATAADYAWTEFKIAQHQFTEARAAYDDLYPDPSTRPLGEGTSVAGAGKGKAVATPAQLEAGVNLQHAAARFDVAQGRLDNLGLDASRLQAMDDEALRLSLLERPRLLGGMRATDVRQLAPDGVIHGYGRPLAGGLHLNLDVPVLGGPGAAHAGTEAGTVVNGAGVVIFRGEVTELGHGGFRITDPADAGLFREYGADGHLTGAGLDVHGPGGVAAGRMTIDFSAGTATLHRPGEPVPGNFAYGQLPGGGHQITSAVDGSWQRFDAAGNQTGVMFDVPAGGLLTGRLEIDIAARTGTVHRPGQAPDQFTYQPRPGGGHQITNPADGSWHRYDPAGTPTEARLPVADPGGAAAGHLRIDLTTGTAALARPGQPVTGNFTYGQLPGGGHQITNIADRSSLRFDAAGNQTGAGLDVRNLTGAPGGRLEIDFAAGTATLQRPGQPVPDNFTYQPLPGGGHQITNPADGSWHRYDPAGTPTGARFPVADQTGNPFGAVEIDIVAGTGRRIDPAGTQHDWPTLQIRPGGYVQLSNTVGEMQRYTAAGGLVDEVIAPRDPLGNVGPSRVHVGVNASGRQVMQLQHGNTAIPNTRVTVDGAGYRITNTGPGAHGGDFRVIGRDGALHSEQISFLSPKGKADGTHLSINYQANQWTRLDSGGHQVAGNANAAPQAGLAFPHTPLPVHGYNSKGAVLVKDNGDLQLIGADKTPFYTRETLGNGAGHPRPTLEVFRASNGKRYWHQWSGAANGTLGDLAAKGVRIFEDLPEGRLWSDHQHGWPIDKVVREYRKAADGGIIRAEVQTDGSWHWYRFDSRGQLTLDGVRDHKWDGTSWKDTYTDAATGRPTVAQTYDSAFNFLPKAQHYREYTVTDQGGGVFGTTAAYKESSPQIKDTASLDVLANGNNLVVRRWAEQRPPEALWKTPDSMSGFDKFISHVAGSKLGAVDFPAPGSLLGDGRFQVYKWTEIDAHGAQVATGVRTVTPEGSFSDFTREGLFVRGEIKLDNGNTVQIGRDIHGTRSGQGHWASLQGNLPTGGSRTTLWREMSGGNVVATGERHFLNDGKHWVDGTPNGAPAGQLLVVRHTGPGGDVVHTVGATNRPLFDPATAGNGPFAGAHTGETITRNTMGQIIGRQEKWLSDQPLPAGQTHPASITVQASGDAHSGRWTWNEGASSGIRVSGRNTRWTGSWDDSYTDFRTVGGKPQPIRDVHAASKGQSVVAQLTHSGAWSSEVRGIDGTPVPNTAGTREFAGPGNTWRRDAPDGIGQPPWRDVNAGGHVLRELVGGKVREYANPRLPTAPKGSGAWKEFDQGAVYRERVDMGNGVFRETETFHKQWRETDANGTLLRYRSLNGVVWERSSLNRWSVQPFSSVGREVESRGIASGFRATNRMWKEANRLQYKAIDGLAGEFHGPAFLIGTKAGLDFTQEFILDFTAQAMLLLAFRTGNVEPQDWFRALVGAALASAIKTSNSVIHDIPALRIKGFKDGLANVDGGKGYNRNPLNHDKHWDNEWAGTENPPRWRQSTYDYFQSTILVNFLAAFTVHAANTALFGLPRANRALAGADAALAGAWGGAGTVVISSTIGSVRNLGHQLGSGRFFHRGGAVDILLSLLERMGERSMGNYLMLNAAGLRPQDNVAGPPPATTTSATPGPPPP